MKRKIKSLSTKIVFSIALVSLLSILVIFNVFEKINKEAFYAIELEKANLVVNTIEPLIALNIYLNMKSRIEQTAKQLIANPNILAVKVLNNTKMIIEKRSQEYEENLEDSFVVEKTIFQPNSQKKIGTLILVYSNKNYNELIEKYTKLLIEVLIVFGSFFFIFSLYIKKLLSPLKDIAGSLKNYSPNTKFDIPYNEQANEIGLISTALNNMQEKILEYSEKQHNINKYLEEKVNEKTLELRKQLYTNSLTGLPNRLSLLQDISGYPKGALLIINIDDFKEINDFFGQVAGDNILISFANRLENIFAQEENVTLIHVGGDEFALFFKEKPQPHEFKNIATALLHNIERMIFIHDGNELSIRVTIGGAYQMEEALEKADIALKFAKKQRKSFLMYDEKLNVEQQYQNNIEWVKKLNQAIDEDRIIPYFQPVFDNATNQIVSYESLIRLIDEDGSIISPANFLTIAKKSKLYPQLTKIMILKSCQKFEHLDADFSINLSVEDMIDEDMVGYIKHTIQKYRVGSHIIFEVLETEGIENYEEVHRFIHDMKSLGCKIAIDDFGSGYSNFEYLLQLNIDYIKIDGSLIKNIDTDKNAKIVVETVVDFAKKLNLVVVAEYVHNEAVHHTIKQMQIERSQGFYLAKPWSELH